MGVAARDEEIRFTGEGEARRTVITGVSPWEIASKWMRVCFSSMSAAATEGLGYPVREGLWMGRAVHQSNGCRMGLHLPLGHLVEELFLTLHKTLDAGSVGGHQAAGRCPLGGVTHSRIGGVGEDGTGSAAHPRACQLPPLSVHLIGDLQVLESVLDLALSQCVDVSRGTSVEMGRGHRAVAGGEEMGVGRGCSAASLVLRQVEGVHPRPWSWGIEVGIFRGFWQVIPVHSLGRRGRRGEGGEGGEREIRGVRRN